MNQPFKYIDVNSNHPKCVINNTAPAVQQRISKLSSTEAIFNQAIPPYQAALDSAGYKHKLKYEKETAEKPLILTHPLT